MSAREGEWDHATRPAEPQDASDFYNDVSSFGSDYIIVITALATPIARRFCGARARSIWGPGRSARRTGWWSGRDPAVL